jgi:hypothetical protein
VNRFTIRIGEDPRAPDPRVQQATVNLFADMGVQPANLQPGLTSATQSSDRIAPVSVIASPANLQRVESVLAISGTAADSGGGIVSAIEVSVEGGRTWHAASGLETWAYTWTTPSSGAGGKETIMSRAVDDSGNIEALAKSVTVILGRPITP